MPELCCHREDCRLMEQYTRQFNYPEESRVKWLADLPGTLVSRRIFVPIVCNVQTELYLQLVVCTEGHFLMKI